MRSGKLVRSRSPGVISGARGAFIARDGRDLVVRRDRHQVLAFDRTARPLLALGNPDHPSLQTPFSDPTAEGSTRARGPRRRPGRHLSRGGAVDHDEAWACVPQASS